MNWNIPIVLKLERYEWVIYIPIEKIAQLKTKKMAIETYISIITLNVNGLNASTKTGQLHVKE